MRNLEPMDTGVEGMPEEDAPRTGAPRTDPSWYSRLGSWGRIPHLRLGAVIALAIAAGLVAWLLVSGNGHSKTAKRAPARGASIQALLTLARSVGHPVYWAGPKPGYTYELTQTTDRRIYIRYLPAGVPVGVNRPQYLAVGTYPLNNAVAAVRTIAKRPGASLVPVGGGGIAAVDPKHSTSIYVAYPGSNFEIEVFDPSPTRARQVVSSGQLAGLGSGGEAASPPKLTTIRDLRALVSSVGHPIYWAGPKPGTRYEQSQTSDGRIYVRYLPPGAVAGDRRQFLTVGTYPVQDAVAAVKRIAKRPGGKLITISAGGVVVVDPQHPASVYLAFPGSNYQIEVFDPSPARARRLVTSGSIVAIG